MVPPELFRHFPFFNPIGERQLARLAAISTERSYQPGEILFEEGASADWLYLVLSGAIELWMRVDGIGRAVLVDVVGPGGIIGWSTLVPPHRNTACGKARCSSRAIAINSSLLRQLVEEDHSLGFYVYRQTAFVIAQRLQDLRCRLAGLLRPAA